MLKIQKAINDLANELREGSDVWVTIDITKELYNVFQSAFNYSVGEFNELENLLSYLDNNDEQVDNKTIIRNRMLEISNEMKVFSQLIANSYSNEQGLIHTSSYYLLKALNTSGFMSSKQVVLFESADEYFYSEENKINKDKIGFLVFEGTYFTIYLIDSHIKLASNKEIQEYNGEVEYD